MSQRFRVRLSDEWAKWAEDEAGHRGQTLSELLENALAAFERELISANEDSIAELYHGHERRRRLKARIRAKLTPAQRELVKL